MKYCSKNDLVLLSTLALDAGFHHSDSVHFRFILIQLVLRLTLRIAVIALKQDLKSTEAWLPFLCKLLELWALD